MFLICEQILNHNCYHLGASFVPKFSEMVRFQKSSLTVYMLNFAKSFPSNIHNVNTFHLVPFPQEKRMINFTMHEGKKKYRTQILPEKKKSVYYASSMMCLVWNKSSECYRQNATRWMVYIGNPFYLLKCPKKRFHKHPDSSPRQTQSSPKVWCQSNTDTPHHPSLIYSMWQPGKTLHIVKLEPYHRLFTPLISVS